MPRIMNRFNTQCLVCLNHVTTTLRKTRCHVPGNIRGCVKKDWNKNPADTNGCTGNKFRERQDKEQQNDKWYRTDHINNQVERLMEKFILQCFPCPGKY